ncbi:MAG: DUF1302 family protein [Candidatus Binatia bacterium]
MLRAAPLLIAVLGTVLLPRPSGAVYLDAGHHLSLRARLYTEAALATEHSEPQTTPARSAFQLVSHRTFFNPEVEGDLPPWLSLGLDDVSFRVALWGFYDGIYDYGPGQYDRARQAIQARFTDGRTDSAPVTRTDQLVDTRKLYTYQPDPVLGRDNGAGHVADLPFRLNEAYLNFTKGPLFVRAGRQTISWGESDTIALLDQSNPFSLSRALPGIFQDIDEARIPLWMLRGTYRLFDVWGPVSGAFLDAYLVPGSIDTTVSPTPIPTASPYAPAESDPQQFVTAFTAFLPASLQPLLTQQLGGLQFVEYDHLPPRTMGNSRYGARIEGLIGRTYTTSVWFYRTLAQTPVPRFLPLDVTRAPLFTGGRGAGPSQLVTETVHGLTTVFGTACSFFSEPLNGVIRGEVEYFLDEPAFVPSENIPFQALLRGPQLRRLLAGLGVQVPAGPDQGRVPRADMLRFEVGYDRFFFLRPLNPTNAFTLVTAVVGSWNLSETFTGTDYRYYGQRKATDAGLRVGVNTTELGGLADVAKLRTVDTDFVDLHPLEWFSQTTLQTDYLHGRVTPRVTAIVNGRGTYAFPVSLVYRWSDTLLFELRYVPIAGGFFGTGFFRDRDQVSARATLLLN